MLDMSTVPIYKYYYGSEYNDITEMEDNYDEYDVELCPHQVMVASKFFRLTSIRKFIIRDGENRLTNICGEAFSESTLSSINLEKAGRLSVINHEAFAGTKRLHQIALPQKKETILFRECCFVESNIDNIFVGNSRPVFSSMCFEGKDSGIDIIVDDRYTFDFILSQKTIRNNRLIIRDSFNDRFDKDWI